jgi:hypothetical protein
MTVSILLELLVAALLGATIYYCWQLNRRLNGLRGGQDELRQLIEHLNDATRRAQAAIAELKMSSEAVGTRLGGQVSGARALADELTLIIEAGNNLADRVSGRLTGLSATPASLAEAGPSIARGPASPPRPLAGAATPTIAPLTASPATAPVPRPAAEPAAPDLLRALREVR